MVFKESLAALCGYASARLDAIGGVHAPAVRLALFGLLCAFTAVLAVSGALILLRLARQARTRISAYLDEIYPPDNASEDDGPALEVALAQLEKSIASSLSSAATTATDTIAEDVRAAQNAALESVAQARTALGAALGDANIYKALDALEGVERGLTGQLMDSAVRLELARRHNASDLPAIAAALSTLRRDGRRCRNVLVVRQTINELGAKSGDSLVALLIKFSLRMALWWASLVGSQMPRTRVRSVPLRAIAERRLGDDLRREFDVSGAALAEVPAHAATLLREAARIARFNLDSAGAELEEKHEDPQHAPGAAAKKLAAEGLDRTAAHISRIGKELTPTWEAFPELGAKNARQAAARIRSDCVVAGTIAEHAGRFADGLFSRWASFNEDGKDSTLTVAQRLWLKLREEAHGFAVRLGLTSLDVRLSQARLEEADIDYVLRETPPVYRRLYRFRPLTDEDFLVGRAEELIAFARLRNRFDQRRSATAAVSGPLGAGKTSLLHCALRRYGNGLAERWLTLENHVADSEGLYAELSRAAGFTQPAGDAKSFMEALLNGEERVACILEGASMLHLRRIGGFAAIRELFSLIALSRGRVMWVLSFTGIGFSYLERTIGLVKRFDEYIELADLSRENLEEAILRRHRVAGYELIFLADKSLPPDVRWRLRGETGMARRQDILRAEFFDELHHAAGGNLHAALYYWLRHSQNPNPTCVEVKPLQPLLPGLLGDLNLTNLFVLLYVLEHDGLTAELISNLLSLPLTDAQLELDFLSRRRILILDPESSNYRINPVLFGPVHRILNDRNLIYA